MKGITQMYTLKNLLIGLLTLCCVFLFCLVTSAPVQAASASAAITADIIEPISIINLSVDGLEFGSIMPLANGTVTVAPDSTRTYSGVEIVPASVAQAAHFQITGVANKSFSITLPTSTMITNGNHTQDMLVDNFVSNPSGSGMVSSDGTIGLDVGATLHVPIGQTVAHYTGSFLVSVAYN